MTIAHQIPLSMGFSRQESWGELLCPPPGDPPDAGLLPANAGDVTDLGSIPGLGRPPREGHGNPLQYSCLDNPMDGGAWWPVLHRITKSQTQLK